jgi:hypothetical protein
LQTSGGIHAHGFLDQVRVFEESNLPLPHVEINQVGSAGLRKRRE